MSAEREGSTAPSIHALRGVVLSYAALGVLWIFGSDYAIEHMVTTPSTRTTISVAKGFVFVFGTAALFYWLLARLARRDARSAEGEAIRAPESSMSFVAALFTMLALVIVAHDRGPDGARNVIAGVLLSLTALAVTVGARRFIGQGRSLSGAMRQRDEAQRRLHTLEVLEAFASATSDAIYVKDLDGKYIFVNEGAARFAGRRPEEILGRDDYAVFTKEVADKLRANDKKTIASRAAQLFYEQLEGATTLREIVSTKGVIEGPSGSAVAVFGMSRERSAYEREEALLRDRVALQERLSAIGEVVPGVLCTLVLDCDDRVRVSEVSESIAGLPGTAREAFAREDDFARSIERKDVAAMRTAASARTPWSFVTRFKHPTLGERWIATWAIPRTSRGAALEWNAFLMDVTDSKRAVLALRETEQQVLKLSLALEQSPASVMVTDTRGTIEYVNEAFCRVSGIASADAIGQNPRILRSGKTSTDTYAALWQALREGRSWTGEFVNRRPDGSEYIEFSTISPVRQLDGTITHYLAVKEDVTARRRNEAELEQHRHHLQELVAVRTAQLEDARVRAERANQAKSSFVATISHEMRTPLNTIVGLSYLLSHSKLRGVDAERVTRIEEATRHLLSTIDTVLDLAKIEAGRLDLVESDFSLPSLLEAVRRISAPMAEQKQLTLSVDCDDAPLLRGDATRLRQILLNLASNAIKFTERGSVQLVARCSREGEGAARVVFSVIDTGIGISREKLGLLFNPFEQVHDDSSRRVVGTGLGLSISKQLVEHMRGTIRASSEPGRGSTFTVELLLSVAKVTALALEPVRHDPNTGARARVLVVDDQRINCDVAEALLQSAGFEAESVESAAAAIERLARGGIDIALIDLQMPEMDGLELTRALRAAAATASLPIIAVSACAFEEDRAACLAAGMNAFVAKPIDAVTLFEAIARLLPRAGAAPAVTDEAQVDEQCFELDRALRSFAGNRSIFSLAAARFVDELSAGSAQRTALEGSDRAQLARACHRLRGTGGALGSALLVRLTTNVERLIRDGAADDALQVERAALLSALSALLSALSAELRKQHASDEPPPDPRRAGAVLASLAPMLRARDFEAASLCQRERGTLRAAYGASSVELLLAVQSFDYRRALALVEALVAQ
jgi:two-component system sensor histidine kinase/response regulator